MKLGINISQNRSYESQIELLKKYGIEGTFVASEHPELDFVIRFLNSNGIVCETLHAPFDKINDMWSDDESLADAMFSRLLDSVDKCAKYNIPVTVVHLSSGKPMPEINPAGEARYARIFEYARDKGVIVALENQRFLENLSYFLEKYPVSFCWDCGHEYGFTKGIRFMDLYGDRCVALHIHDNRCGIDTDDHLIPFDGNIDYTVVVEDLVKHNYRGTLMLEVGKKNKLYDNMTDEEYISRAESAAKRLSDMIEELKIN